MESGKKIYFASDLHLGAPNEQASRDRELRFIKWLDQISDSVSELFLVGDVFDFWFDYKTVVPRGHVRILGKLAELSDAGIPIHYFIGNHDMWLNGYFEEELGVQIHEEPIVRELGGKRFLIGHGDGLGPGDYGYKLIKKVFRNPICHFLFRWIHPDLGVSLARFWSKTSRYGTGDIKEEQFLGEENEWLAQYCRRKLQEERFDYFIFGHRHLPLDISVGENSRYINLGDWLVHNTYATFDGNSLTLGRFGGDRISGLSADSGAN